jgi:hypothetical protein
MISNGSQSPNFETFKEPRNRFQGIGSASLCSLAGRYDCFVPTQFLDPKLFKNSSTGVSWTTESIANFILLAELDEN